jgi:60S ribosome subunit biogenesis protein NIP7
MRPLTESETEVFFGKLAKYIGRNITRLIDRSDSKYCFRLQKNRIFYVAESVLKMAETIPRKQLISLGVCFGKFTKSGKFILQVTCLDIIAPYAKYKIWIKKNGEMTYLYGNNILRAHVAKMTEDLPEYQGVLVCSHQDTPLGFALSAKSALECRKLDPTSVVAFHQTDVGEYVRDEETLV